MIENYPDSKCVYGYMTLCDDCKPKAPHWVDTTQTIKDYLPKLKCEMCGKTPKVAHYYVREVVMFQFSQEVRPLVQHLTESLKAANAAQRIHADQKGTYGIIYRAICFVLWQECDIETEQYFREHGANFGGNESWLVDLEKMVEEAKHANV